MRKNRNLSGKWAGFYGELEKMMLKVKKVALKFGRMKLMPYLCIRFENSIAGWSSGSSLGS